MGRIGRFAVIGATVLLVACGQRDEARNDTGAVGTAGVSAGDRNFFEESLGANMAEVELGGTAQQRATHPEVKMFAEMMVRDHTQSRDALRKIAQQYAIQVGADLSEKHRDLTARLTNLNGSEFDREYMDVMIDAHEESVDRLQSRSSEDRFGENKGQVRPESSDNPLEANLNQWAASALPTTRHHLEEARRIRDLLNNRPTPRE